MASVPTDDAMLTAEEYDAMLTAEFDWLSDDERAAIAGMRAQLLERGQAIPEEQIELGGPLRLLRFAQGFDFDLTAASDLYISMMAWRKKKNVDAVRTWLLERWDDDVHAIEGIPHDAIVQACAPTRQNVITEKSPHIFVIESTGKIDAAALVEVGEKQYKEYTTYMMEHKSILLDRLSREQKMIVKTSQIRDLLDAPISSWLYNRGAFPMVQSTIKMAQGAYPETVDKIYVVNTPWLMSTVWSIVQGWMAPKTTEKVKVISDVTQAREVLSEVIDLELLPTLVVAAS